ncbi:37S ribosomal protein S19, mitochondrial [Metarhizium anisopliae]|nr:37S ribosomal protein S19, mitochondrial [Metarhizium anisopliae]
MAKPQIIQEADCRLQTIYVPVTTCKSGLFIYQCHVTTYNFWSTSVHPDTPISRLTVCAVTDSQIQNASNSSAVEALSVERLPIVFPKKQGDKVPPVRTQARSATVLPNFVGLKFEIHNGKDYHQVTITEDMVGHKLGEFSPYVCTSLR